jgi:hypothetical protein
VTPVASRSQAITGIERFQSAAELVADEHPAVEPELIVNEPPDILGGSFLS